jgi:hypothetical protein
MADLKPMLEVKPLEEYTAIVLLAPLYGFTGTGKHWLFVHSIVNLKCMRDLKKYSYGNKRTGTSHTFLGI